MIRRGLLSDYFEGVAFKLLSAVETTPTTSNQHEFNGSKTLRRLFGDDDRKGIPARFIRIDEEQDGVSVDSTLTWYDSRRSHPTRTEYRLYYPTNDVTRLMKPGDAFFLALRSDGSAMVVVTPSCSTIENQLQWLFGLDDEPVMDFAIREVSDRNPRVDFVVRYILDELGIEADEPESDRLDALIGRFGTRFPNTREFSALARSSLVEVSPHDDPDTVLMAWLEREELLFKRLERVIVAERLRTGFVTQGEADVDGFLSFSLSVQNRRKSRAGQSLENHLEALFSARNISFSRGAETENRHKPDFLFPGVVQYRDPLFPFARLTMLASKSTLKDRWRQVLTEAERIPSKHLLTLEPAISEHQTDQMRGAQLQLVLPSRLHATYRERQREWLISLGDFIELIRSRQP